MTMPFFDALGKELDAAASRRKSSMLERLNELTAPAFQVLLAAGKIRVSREIEIVPPPDYTPTINDLDGAWAGTLPLTKASEEAQDWFLQAERGAVPMGQAIDNIRALDTVILIEALRGQEQDS